MYVLSKFVIHCVSICYVYVYLIFDSDVVIALSLMFCFGTFVIFLIICYCQRLKSQSLKQFRISQKQSSSTKIPHNTNINGNENESDNEYTIIKLKHGLSNDDISRSNEVNTNHLSLNQLASNSQSHSNQPQQTLRIPTTKSKPNSSINKNDNITIPTNPIQQIPLSSKGHLPKLISCSDHQFSPHIHSNVHSKTHHLGPKPGQLPIHTTSLSYSPIYSSSKTTNNNFPSPVALQPRHSATSCSLPHHNYNHHQHQHQHHYVHSQIIQPKLIQNRQQQIQRAQIPRYTQQANQLFVQLPQYPPTNIITSTQSNIDQYNEKSLSPSSLSLSTSTSSTISSDCLSTKKCDSKTSRAYSFEDDENNNHTKLNNDKNENNYKCIGLISPRDLSFDTNQTVVTSIKSPSNHDDELSGAVNSVLGDIIGIDKGDKNNTNNTDNKDDKNDHIESSADTSRDIIYPIMSQHGSSQFSLSETPQPESYRNGYVINKNNRYTNVITNIRTKKKPYKY